MAFPVVLQKLASKYQTVRHPKETLLAVQDKASPNAYLIKDGIVRMYVYNDSEEEITISYLDEGDFFPLECVFDKSPTSLFYYETVTSAELVKFNCEDLRNEFTTDLELSCVIQDELTSQLIAALVQVHGLGHRKARDKIIQSLHYFVLRFGVKQDDGKYLVDLKLTHSDIANFVGLTRETVSNELVALRDEGLIDYESSLYRIDVEQLLKDDLIRDLDETIITPEPEACEDDDCVEEK
jgi:CRP-like cAMP-binding protein